MTMMPLEALYASEMLFALSSDDRIVLRAYEKSLSYGGGFYTVAKRLRPTEPVTQSWIASLTRRFHLAVKLFAGEHGIPVEDRTKDHEERMEDLAERYRAQFPRPQGVYLIVRQRELAKVWHSYKPESCPNPDYRLLSRETSLVLHYYFYLVDPQWGPMIVKICSHAPFGASVILNGHQWLARQAAAQGLRVEAVDNAIVSCDDPPRLQALADSLSESRMRAVADKWLYRLLPIFTKEERLQAGLSYQYSHVQYERSHNLVFKKPEVLNDLFERLIDANRRYFGPATIKTVFGVGPQGLPSKELGVRTKKTPEGLTSFRIQMKRSSLRQYNKLLGRLLRTELCVNDPDDLGIGRDLSQYSELRARADGVILRFEERERAVYQKALPTRALEELAAPARVGKTQVAGLRIDHPRVLAVAESMVGATNFLAGFTNQSLRQEVQKRLGLDEDSYGPTRMNYDLKKFRAQSMVEKIEGVNSYRLTQSGLPQVLSLLQLRHGLLEPVLSMSRAPVQPFPGKTSPSLGPLETHYKAWDQQLHQLLGALNMPLKN
jgi:hypothetical protein